MTTNNTNKKKYAIGIDLGTTTTVVSIYDQTTKQSTLIDINGYNYIPSVVSFKISNGQPVPVYVGIEAVNNTAANPKNTIYNSKRFFGLLESDIVKDVPQGAHSHRLLTYQSLKDVSLQGYTAVIRDGKVMIKLVSESGEECYIAPTDVSVRILQEVMKYVLGFLGAKAEDIEIHAVITVPAYFNNYQREEVKKAGTLAGFVVNRIINEPTAAALSKSDKLSGVSDLLVVDLGGGTFDVSLLKIEGEVSDMTMEVKITEGHLALGGSDFDKKISDMILKEFDRINAIDYAGNKINLRNNPEGLSKLRKVSESAKHILSQNMSTTINLASIEPRIQGNHSFIITRNMFEDAIQSELKMIKEIIDLVLKTAKEKNIELDLSKTRMLLTGGSTRVPSVVNVCKTFGIGILPQPQPDYDVATGAGKLSASLVQGSSTDVLLIDVSSTSLGIETVGGVYAPIVPKNTPIPTKQTQVFSTASDNQTSTTIRIFQGERAMAKDNRFLDQFELSGIPPAPRGVPVIEVTFALDANGIVNVTAREKNTGQEAKITVNSTMKDEDLKRMKENAERFKEYDEKLQKNIQLRNTADNKLHEAQKMLKEYDAKLPEDFKTEMSEAIKSLETVLNANADLTNDTFNYSEIEEKSNALSNVVMKVYEKISATSSNESATEPNTEQPQN